MATTEKATVVLDRVVTELTGEPFYAENIPASLRQALKFSEGGGFVAPMWLLAKGFPHLAGYTANSEEHSGPGEFREQKGRYVVTLHGGVDGNGALTPDIIETALEMHKSGKRGLTAVYAANLSQLFKGNMFSDLLQGGMPDGSTLPVYSFGQAVAGEHQRHLYDFTRFAIVRTIEQARQTISVHGRIDRLVDREGKVNDSQVIAYTASTNEGQDFIKRARSLASGKLAVWHPFNNDKFNPYEPQGRVLFLGFSGYDALLGDYGINLIARFVGVAPKARAAMQATIEQRLDASTKSALEAGERFEYKGKLYAPISAKNVNLQNTAQ